MTTGGNSAFCPICNKGRQRPLLRSMLFPSDVKDISRCGICKRLFLKGKEVEIIVKEKPKLGIDLAKMIKDHYRCPVCYEVCAGLMSWASHCAQRHGLPSSEFKKKYGEPEWSAYGIDFEKNFNPTKR